MFFYKDKKNLSRKSGFTLIELMVVLVVFVALTGIMISSQSKFDGTILLNNLAYDIALSIREAQTYGVNVKEFSAGLTSKFSGYGIRFDPAVDNKHYILFSDVNDNNYFDIPNSNPICPKGDPECVKKYTLTRGSFIQSVCVGLSESTCDTQYDVNLDKSISIIFRRPNPDAIITIGAGGEMSCSGHRCQIAKIIISSANNATTSIVVTALGDIYVKK